ncbi:ribonuclease HI family protein [bacterium]|nr:ribonuclease HI family protein [bacterium]
MDLNAFIDGGARGNPGPAAIGIHICDEDGNPLFEEGTFIGHATNNEAEYKALIRLLEVAASDPVIHSFEGGTLRIHCDSNLVVQQVLGNWKIKEPRLKELYDEVQQKKPVTGMKLRIKHVPREENKDADRLVNEALDREALKGHTIGGN